MTQPSFGCPRCGYETFLPSDVQAGYCPVCRWWTGDSLLGSPDVMRQNEIDGPLSLALFECEPTRAEVEADWFGPSDPAEVVHQVRGIVEQFAAMNEAAAAFGESVRSTALRSRVARTVQALRRLREQQQ